MLVTDKFRPDAELRKKSRRQFQYAARFFTRKDEPLRPCTIRDISNTGARLVLESDQELPDKFILLLIKMSALGAIANWFGVKKQVSESSSGKLLKVNWCGLCCPQMHVRTYGGRIC